MSAPPETPIASLSMYDWPEARSWVDDRWRCLHTALAGAGLHPPDSLNRHIDTKEAWLHPQLWLGETCTWPLATALAGRVRYVATEIHDAPGCRPGGYRSVVVARRGTPVDPPTGRQAHLPNMSGATTRMAANSADSLSGYRALLADCAKVGTTPPRTVLWTGAHRASVRAVCEGRADLAAIDCVTWSLALNHEPAARDLVVVGWTAERPALPLITALATDETTIGAMRAALVSAGLAVVHDDPLAGLDCPL